MILETGHCVILTKRARQFLLSVVKSKPPTRMLLSQQHFSLSPDITNSNVLLCEVETGVAQEVYIPLCLGPIRSPPASQSQNHSKLDFVLL